MHRVDVKRSNRSPFRRICREKKWAVYAGNRPCGSSLDFETVSERGWLRSGMKKWGNDEEKRDMHVLTLLGSHGEGLKLHSDADSLSIVGPEPRLQRNAGLPFIRLWYQWLSLNLRTFIYLYICSNVLTFRSFLFLCNVGFIPQAFFWVRDSD